MKIDIPLGSLAASDSEPQRSVSVGIRPDPLDDVMSTALERPNGVELEYENGIAATAARFRFYRRRNFYTKRNIHTFNELAFTINGKVLRITRHPAPVMRDL